MKEEFLVYKISKTNFTICIGLLFVAVSMQGKFGNLIPESLRYGRTLLRNLSSDQRIRDSLSGKTY
jgi:hypothetical protein